jgi:hypothetical protein
MRSELVNRDYGALVPQVLEKLFLDVQKRNEAHEILAAYQDLEPDRVRLGILKASNGDLQEIIRLVDIAMHDWRDLLCIAEFPLSSKRWGLREKDPERYDKVLEKEQGEYDQWLKNVLAT